MSSTPQAPVTPATRDSYEALRLAINARARLHFIPADVPLDLIPQFADAFTARVDRILQKFADGQRKHGGDIRERLMKHDRGQEIDDLLVYDIVEDLQGSYVKIRV